MKKLIIFIVLVIGAAPASAQRVKVESDQKLDLSRYKTYEWAQPIPVGNPVIVRTIVDAIDQEMAAKGLKMVNSEPQLRVAFWTATESDLHISHPTASNSTTALGNPMPAGAQSWPVTKGTLVVNLSDAATKSSVWRASASQLLDRGPTGNPDKDAKTVEKPIRKAVAKMFKQFPNSK